AYFSCPALAQRKLSRRANAASQHGPVPLCVRLDSSPRAAAAVLRLAEDAGAELVESLPIDGDATGAHFYRPGIARRKGARCDLAAVQDRQVSRCVHFDSSGIAGRLELRMAQDDGRKIVE